MVLVHAYRAMTRTQLATFHADEMFRPRSPLKNISDADQSGKIMDPRGGGLERRRDE